MAVLGIIGGLGPLSGAEFYRRIIEKTDAKCDSDHISVLLDGTVTTPDRSAFLCQRSADSPYFDLLARARRLQENGASLLAIPCNTAHAFYSALCEQLSIPILHIIAETVATAYETGARCIGVLCTDGTKTARLYDSFCAPLGIACHYPTERAQADVDTLIYRIKSGKRKTQDDLLPFCRPLWQSGCDLVILGCTELSLCQIKEKRILDATDCLAKRCVRACQKPLKGERN